MHRSYSPADLLPHRPPMILIDEIVSFDEAARSLTAAVNVREQWKGNWVSIEYMAQTAGALVGLFDRIAHAENCARPGFLLGTRRLTLNLDAFDVGARYLVTATCAFEDAETASFICAIRDSSDVVVATATINVFRPSDLAAFLESQRT